MALGGSGAARTGRRAGARWRPTKLGTKSAKGSAGAVGPAPGLDGGGADRGGAAGAAPADVPAPGGGARKALGRRGADASRLPNGIRGFLFKTQLPKLADLLGALEAVADERGATVGQVSLAWCLRARGRGKTPPLALVGARTPDMVRDALGALRLDLSPSDVESLAATAARCPQAQVNAFQTK